MLLVLRSWFTLRTSHPCLTLILTQYETWHPVRLLNRSFSGCVTMIPHVVQNIKSNGKICTEHSLNLLDCNPLRWFDFIVTENYRVVLCILKNLIESKIKHAIEQFYVQQIHCNLIPLVCVKLHSSLAYPSLPLLEYWIGRFRLIMKMAYH